jgi:hypothetical protein
MRADALAEAQASLIVDTARTTNNGPKVEVTTAYDALTIADMEFHLGK